MIKNNILFQLLLITSLLSTPAWAQVNEGSIITESDNKEDVNNDLAEEDIDEDSEEDVEEDIDEEIEEIKVYILPKDANCSQKNGLIFCTDNNNKPITGEMRKYSYGNIETIYSMKDGYLEGNLEVYHYSGNIKSEKEYKQGVLEGYAKNYDDTGNFVSEIPYKNNKKEGIAVFETENSITKMIYINDKANGDARTWDKKSKQLLYNLKMVDDNVISGKYSYYNPKDIRCCQPKDSNICLKNPNADCCKQLPTIQIDIPNIVIEGLNQKCLDKHDEMSCNKIPAIAHGSSNQCNQEWRQNKAVRNQILTYFQDNKE